MPRSHGESLRPTPAARFAGGCHCRRGWERRPGASLEVDRDYHGALTDCAMAKMQAGTERKRQAAESDKAQTMRRC